METIESECENERVMRDAYVLSCEGQAINCKEPPEESKQRRQPEVQVMLKGCDGGYYELRTGGYWFLTGGGWLFFSQAKARSEWHDHECFSPLGQSDPCLLCVDLPQSISTVAGAFIARRP